VEGGANVEGTDADLYTALHLAVGYGHQDMCRLLLDRGANLVSLDVWKDIPLHWSSQEGHLSVVKLLVER
jgi:ankyrin repeat protein